VNNTDAIIFAISFSAFVLTLTISFCYNKIMMQHKKAITNLQKRIKYMEIVLDYHNLVPLPWELPDSETDTTTKDEFKRAGNVIFLK
tara:strand:- start:1527 stop:1787 length:261 start_codon:yes stop_codon:yes gene_type:complete